MDFRETQEEKNSSNGRAEHVRGAIAAVSLLLVLFVTLSLSATLEKSPTSDEGFHLVAGYSYLKWRDFRLNPEHPPLTKVLAALPLLALDINDAPLNREQRDQVQANRMYGWLLANRWLFASNDAEKIFFYAKLPMTVLGAILGIFVFCWARDLYGFVAGITALSIYSLDPNIIAHTPIVHTDIPFALFLFAGTYYFWRTLREITWFNWTLAALFFSLAVITKFSALITPLIWGVLGISRIRSLEPIRLRFSALLIVREWLGKTLWVVAVLLSAGVLSYILIWTAYGFRYDAVSGQYGALALGKFAETSEWFQPIVQTNTQYHLLPEAWLSGLHYAYFAAARSSYLLGEISDKGFWLYFPIAFGVKTPLPTILLLLVSLTIFLTGDRQRKDCIFLFIPILMIFSAAVFARMNIGLRHILAIYPFLFVWLGGSVSNLWVHGSVWKKGLVIILGVWLAVSSLKTFPDFLAYFNETIGSRPPYEILVDSNLDWGQDLKGLKRWMDKNSVKQIQLAYFGTADPAYYGVEAVYKPGTWKTVMSTPGLRNDPGVSSYIAVSATHLTGVYLRPSNPYVQFLLREPVATIGHSILIYRTD
jgi:hypothetical protein